MGESAEQILQKLEPEDQERTSRMLVRTSPRRPGKHTKASEIRNSTVLPTKEETNKLLDEGIDLFAVPDYKDN